MVNNQINIENNITQEQKINQRNQNIPIRKQNHFVKQSYKRVQKLNKEKTNLRNKNIQK